ncbi:MAG: enediyne biosynthesis protein UnbU [Blastocatellia bacterium]
MKAAENITTLNYYPKRDPKRRVFALWYFTTLLIIWNILGYSVLGFEQAWIHPIAGVVTAILMQFLLECVDAWANKRALRFLGGVEPVISFLPPAIIPGLACAMLIYPNTRVSPVVFAAGASIASKVIFRAPVGGGRTQHIFNPSNLGIVATLLLFPWVGMAPAYHFTENITGPLNWVLPGIILISGIIIHSLFTGRLPLCLAWIGGFLAQGLIRGLLLSSSWFVPLMPMTSAAFIIFTLYMIPDPATTPLKVKRQVAFGLAVAAIYGVLQVLHIVYGLFIALILVSAIRGICLHIYGVFTLGWVTRERYAQKGVVASGD